MQIQERGGTHDDKTVDEEKEVRDNDAWIVDQ